MKKLRFLLIAALLSFAFLMTGCSNGSSLDTNLTFEKDYTGNRTMDLIVNDSVFQQYFSGSYEDLDALITNTCPESLTWGRTQDEDGTQKYTFVMNFSSVEDYKAKVEKLIGEERNLTMEVAEGLWSNGVIVEEGFSSSELMQWLKDAIVAAGYVEEGNAGNIFSNGNCYMTYNGDTRSCYSNISVNTVEYLRINSVTLMTEVLGVDDFKETVVIDVPLTSMEKKGAEIAEFMNNATPAGASMTADDSSGTGTVYTITCGMTNMQGLQNQLQTILGEGKATLKSNEEEAENTSPFRYSLKMDQTLNFGNFVAGDNMNLRCEYLIKLPEGFSMDRRAQHYYNDENPSYPGFTRIFDTYVYGMDAEFPIYMNKTFTVASMNVETANKGLDSWSRTTEFILKESPSETELNGIVEQFTKRVPAAEEGKDALKIEISSKTKDGVASVTVEQKGTTEEMEQGSRALFDDTSSLTYAKKTGAFQVKKEQAVIDSFRYAGVIGDISEDFVLNYTLKIGGMSSCTYTNVDDNLLKSNKGGKLTAEFTYPNQKVEWYGTYFDVLALVTIILMVAGVALVIFAVAKVGMAVSKEKKASAPMVAPAAAATAAAPVAASATAFCSNCGTKLEAGTVFCSNCGTKVE